MTSRWLTRVALTTGCLLTSASASAQTDLDDTCSHGNIVSMPVCASTFEFLWLNQPSFESLDTPVCVVDERNFLRFSFDGGGLYSTWEPLPDENWVRTDFEANIPESLAASSGARLQLSILTPGSRASFIRDGLVTVDGEWSIVYTQRSGNTYVGWYLNETLEGEMELRFGLAPKGSANLRFAQGCSVVQEHF